MSVSTALQLSPLRLIAPSSTRPRCQVIPHPCECIVLGCRAPSFLITSNIVHSIIFSPLPPSSHGFSHFYMPRAFLFISLQVSNLCLIFPHILIDFTRNRLFCPCGIYFTEWLESNAILCMCLSLFHHPFFMTLWSSNCLRIKADQVQITALMSQIKQPIPVSSFFDLSSLWGLANFVCLYVCMLLGLRITMWYITANTTKGEKYTFLPC